MNLYPIDHSQLSRQRFERLIDITVESTRSGKMHFSMDSDVPKSLLRIRKLPNGRVNLVTVNQTARTTINARAAFDKNQYDLNDDENPHK
jgi:hypothetical protein